MADSIRKRIVDLLMARLVADDAGQPPSFGVAKVSKNRGIPIGGDELANGLYSVYFVNDQPSPVGDPRRGVVMSRKLLMEVRIIVKGTDDAADPHCIWVTERIVSADRCIAPDNTQLALGIVEGETPFEPLEGAQGEITVTRIRFVVDYKTSRLDITQTA